ncbi:MAG: hypothetical protein ACFFB2_19260 [Promethearchaeota archaeon]
MITTVTTKNNMAASPTIWRRGRRGVICYREELAVFIGTTAIILKLFSIQSQPR